MTDNVGDRKALVRMQLQHARNQVFEFLRVETFSLSAGVASPEEIGAVSCNQLVVGVVVGGLFERRMTGVKDKENDAKSEQIGNLTLIGLSLEDFGAHVTGSSNEGRIVARSVTTFERAGESKVHNFDVVVLVKEDVLGFEIAMRETLGVDVVQTLQHLFEVVAAHLFREGTSVGNIVEELTARDEFLHNVCDLFVATLLLPLRLFLEGVVLDHMLVIEGGRRFDFSLEEHELLRVERGVIEIKDFKCVFGAVSCLSKLDFG